MSSQLGPPLIGLFAARPPLRYVAPVDTAPEKRNTPKITGLAGYLSYIGQHDQDYEPTETLEEAKARRREEKRQKHQAAIKRALKEYNPAEDTQIRGDPYKTLFVSRLAYSVTEEDLIREFSRYGPVERARLVCNQDGSSRGYAFIVFERERDMKVAYRESDGIKIKDRRILVDVERGRTVKEWKPMRLGGGLGGRHYTKPTRRVDVYPRGPPRQYSERPRPVQSTRDDPRRDRPDRERSDRPDRSDYNRSDRPDRERSERPDRFDRRSHDRSFGGPPRPNQGRGGIGFDRATGARNDTTFTPATTTTTTSPDPRSRPTPAAPWLRERSRDRADDRGDTKRRRY